MLMNHKIRQVIKRVLSLLIGRDFSHFKAEVSDRYDVISFDVFDTLVLRKVKRPADVFGLLYDEPDFPGKRVRAEREARGESTLEDISLDDIYAHLPGYDPEIEIRKEMEVCYANPEAAALYRSLIEAGKRVIIVSDMYLSAETIGSILADAGYSGYERLFVSSEYGLTKKSGHLYDKVMEEMGTKRILHIGDNPLSDYISAKHAGMDAFLYRRGK